ncbi:MAG: hypothetical protein ACOC8F_07415 [Planctomycetota bacterium]
MTAVSSYALWALLGAGTVFGLVTLGLAVVVRRRRRPADRSNVASQPRLGEAAGNSPEDVDRLLRRADQIAGELDAKAGRLERLISEADARIARMGAPEADPPGQYAADGPDAATRDAIVRLRRNEVAPADIARRLGMDVGEVELVLNLDAHRARRG